MENPLGLDCLLAVRWNGTARQFELHDEAGRLLLQTSLEQEAVAAALCQGHGRRLDGATVAIAIGRKGSDRLGLWVLELSAPGP